MWKTILLCASLFSGAAGGLAAIAKRIEPSALLATSAIGLCVIGVVLILAAPARVPMQDEEEQPAPAAPRPLEKSL